MKEAWNFIVSNKRGAGGGGPVYKTVSGNEKIDKVLCTFHYWSKENVSLELNQSCFKEKL